MTQALCFHCGNTKFGALLPCMKCGGGPSDNIELDIAFTDHNMSDSSIEAFGRIIQSINAVTDDPATRFWAFIHYVSEEHPSILRVDLDEEQTRQLRMLLETIEIPRVVVEPSPMARLRGDA